MRFNLQNDFTLLPLHSFGLELARSTYVTLCSCCSFHFRYTLLLLLVALPLHSLGTDSLESRKIWNCFVEI